MKVYEVRKVRLLTKDEDSWVADFANSELANRVSTLLNKESKLSEMFIVCEEERTDTALEKREDLEWLE